MLAGSLIGIVGALIWYGMLFAGRGESTWFYTNHCPPTSVSPDCGYEFFAPFFFGPAAGFLFSVVMSVVVNRFVLKTSSPEPRRVFALTAITYLSILSFLAIAGRLIRANGAPEILLPIGFPLLMSGIDWAGPAALLAWALVAGLTHAVLSSRASKALG